ncbi:hypothetical protein HYR54_16685 [Candidatus Acetothermia bacterium]|nr:hypothetical protein [Candidatus Acetothermia bacterium]
MAIDYGEEYSLKDKFLGYVNFVEAGEHEIVERFHEGFGYPAGKPVRITNRDELTEKLQGFQTELRSWMEMIYDYYMFFTSLSEDKTYDDYRLARLQHYQAWGEDKFRQKVHDDYEEMIEQFKKNILRKLELTIDRPGNPAILQICVTTSAVKIELAKQETTWRMLRFFEHDPYDRWFDKLGKCPHCMRFFVKSRRDQIFINNSHASRYWQTHKR